MKHKTYTDAQQRATQTYEPRGVVVQSLHMSYKRGPTADCTSFIFAARWHRSAYVSDITFWASWLMTSHPTTRQRGTMLFCLKKQSNIKANFVCTVYAFTEQTRRVSTTDNISRQEPHGMSIKATLGDRYIWRRGCSTIGSIRSRCAFFYFVLKARLKQK